MIFNRPSNLWLAAATALFNVGVLIAAANGVEITAALIAAVNVALGTAILLIAYQPPVVNTGDSVVVKTNNGHTDKRVTFSEEGEATSTPIPHTEHLKE